MKIARLNRLLMQHYNISAGEQATIKVIHHAHRPTHLDE